MAEIVLAALILAGGIACLLLGIISDIANHIGGATNADAVDHGFTFYCLIASILMLVLGGWILF